MREELEQQREEMHWRMRFVASARRVAAECGKGLPGDRAAYISEQWVKSDRELEEPERWDGIEH